MGMIHQASAADTRESTKPFGALAFLAWDHDWNEYHSSGDKLDKTADLLKEAGVDIVRVDFLWPDIEPTPGNFVFDKYDRIVKVLSSRGIKILAMLHYNVPWDSSTWNQRPDPEHFTRYATSVADHFKNDVKYWEIWNEPDYDFYWTPQDEMQSYTDLLKKVYPALKAVDPTCVVVLGGLSQSCSIQLKRVYQWGGKDFFDVVNIHPFVDPLQSNAMELLHGEYRGVYKVMEKNKDEEKPIWFTELGCPGIDRADQGGWFAGKNPTEAEQADWVERIYTEPLQWKGVQKIFWAFFRDTPNHFHNGTDYFGLIREDFSKKPSFERYRSVAKALGTK